MKPKSALRSFLTIAGSSLLAISYSHAGQTWDGGGADSNWNTSANWSGDSLPIFTNAIFFNGITKITPSNNLAADSTIGGINFINDGSTNKTSFFTLSGNRITLGGNITTTANTAGSTITDIISLNMILNGDRTITTNQLSSTVQHNLTISGVISQDASNRSLTKAGGGTLTLNGTATNTFAGGLVLNGGTLALDYANIAASTSLVADTNTLTLAGGNLSLRGKTGANTTTQTLGNVTVNAGGGTLLINPNGGTSTSLTLGTLAPTVQGSSLTLGTALSAGSGTVTITTTTDKDATGIYGGRLVFANGTANTGYDWATTASGGSPYTLSAYSGYAAMATSGTDTVNSRITATSTLSGGLTTNSLKIENPAASQSLALGGNLLTLTGGGLLVTGTNAVSITGTVGATRLTAGNGSGSYDLVVHQFNSGGLTIGAVVGDNGGNATALTKSGTGAMTLSESNTFTGGLFVNSGTVTLANAGALNSTAGSENAVNVASSGVLSLNGNSVVISNLTGGGGAVVQNNLAGTATLTVGNSNNYSGTYAGVIQNGAAGTLALTKVGTGTLTLSATNTYTGLTTISAGTLKLVGSGDASLGAARTYSIASGAVLNFDGNTGVPAGTSTIDGTGTLRISGGNFSSTADGRDMNMSLGAGAVLDIESGGTFQNGGFQNFTWTNNKATLNVKLGGLFRITDGAEVFADALTGAGEMTINNSNGGTGPGLTLGQNNGSGTFTGNITAPNTRLVNLTKNGTGTQIFSGSTTWTGTTTINGGTVQYAKTSSLYAGVTGSWTKTKITVNSGGTIAFNVGGTNEFQTGDVTTLLTGLGGTVTNNGLRAGSTIAFDTTNASDNTFTIANTIANTTSTGGGAVGLKKLGTNTLVLSGSNTYTGVTTLTDGTLSVATIGDGGVAGNLGQAGAGAANIVFDGGTLKYTGVTATSNRAFTINANKTATIETANDISFAGATGAATNGALTKTGAGTLTLTGTNTYTGATNIEGGKLVVNGNISTSLLTTVKTGATLGGTGTVGALTIDSGGFFSPGNSPGIEDVVGNYIQNGTLQVEIEGLTAGDGAGLGYHDQVVVTGSVTLGLNSVLSLTTFTGSYSANNLIFILLNDDIDAINGTFNGLAQGATVGTYAGQTWKISYNADSIANTFTGTANGNDIALMAIPEPRAALLGGIGMLLLLRRRRA